jgi:hypothetical protein
MRKPRSARMARYGDRVGSASSRREPWTLRSSGLRIVPSRALDAAIAWAPHRPIEPSIPQPPGSHVVAVASSRVAEVATSFPGATPRGMRNRRSARTARYRNCELRIVLLASPGHRNRLRIDPQQCPRHRNRLGLASFPARTLAWKVATSFPDGTPARRENGRSNPDVNHSRAPNSGGRPVRAKLSPPAPRHPVRDPLRPRFLHCRVNSTK